jgi:hypothetical protein
MLRRTHKALLRGAVTAGLAAGIILAGGGTAEAGQPADHACVGESFSALATTQPAPGAFGAAVRSFAQDPFSPPGLGDGIQAFQAGQVPDQVVPNTCND